MSLDASVGSSAYITLRNVGLERNGRWLFRELNLDIPQGSFLAIVGSSGVGKTSLLKCIAGMIKPTEGEICYCGEEAHCETSEQQVCHLLARRRVAMVFQDLSLILHASLLNNVLCGRLGRYPWWQTLLRFSHEDKQQALAYLQDLGIGHLAHRDVGTVSGGERQRVAFARALFQQPDLYLTDEPVASLDAYYAGRVLGLLRQECTRDRRTVLCVLHQAQQVEHFADMVLGLNPQEAKAWNLRIVKEQKNLAPKAKA
jgi:phosphonate transport system ATP-binding protein